MVLFIWRIVILEKIGKVVGWVIGTTFMTLLRIALISLVAGGATMGIAVLITGVKSLMSAIAL